MIRRYGTAIAGSDRSAYSSIVRRRASGAMPSRSAASERWRDMRSATTRIVAFSISASDVGCSMIHRRSPAVKTCVTRVQLGDRVRCVLVDNSMDLADDEGPVRAENPAMKRLRDRHEVARILQHQVSSMVGGEIDRAQRDIDHLAARPSE